MDTLFPAFFSSYGFPVSGTSAPYTADRTLSDRLAEVKNVKDFGAKGNGQNDDTGAIQAAINWTSGAYRGVIFFPLGTYITSAPIILPNAASGNQQASLVGVGPLSYIHNTNTSNTGFVFDRSVWQAESYGGWVVEKLRIKNDSSDSNSGALRIRGCAGLTVRDCRLEGFTGLQIFDSIYAAMVTGCCINSAGISGSTFGILGGGDTLIIIGCDISGFNTGISMDAPADWPYGPAGTTSVNIYSCRISACETGIRVGHASNSFLARAIVSGCSFYQNSVGLNVDYAAASRFCGLSIQASSGTYGILGNNQANNAYEAISITGSFIAGIAFGYSMNRIVMLAVDASGVTSTPKWSLPDGEPGTKVITLQCA